VTLEFILPDLILFLKIAEYARKVGIDKTWRGDNYGESVVMPMLTALVSWNFNITRKSFKKYYDLKSRDQAVRRHNELLLLHLFNFLTSVITTRGMRL